MTEEIPRYKVATLDEAMPMYERPTNPDGSRRRGGLTREEKAHSRAIRTARRWYQTALNAIQDLKQALRIEQERHRTTKITLAQRDREIAQWRHDFEGLHERLTHAEAAKEATLGAARSQEVFNRQAFNVLAQIVTFVDRHISPPYPMDLPKLGYIIAFSDGVLDYKIVPRLYEVRISNSRLNERTLVTTSRGLTADSFTKLAAFARIPDEDMELRVPAHIAYELYPLSVLRQRHLQLGDTPTA